ncbi:phage portal protein [Clostridium sp. DJ247]|uniref:phage portal protein n=1 Tax=Clostridium sp. DJ247 TaxID=2726188 RepID=UPI00162321C6|nr:phage portal protein [Clostridium sp. DJ247]MBC2579984.1 phage portal protein [Clostridium sp. DJ247]
MDNRNNIRDILLDLNSKELKERKKVKKDFYFFLGECRDSNDSMIDEDKLGQSWIVNDDIDYVPTQDIRNKVKPLLRKQARFMFGKEPDILFKPYNPEDKDKCEELRQYIDNILEDNSFWSLTLKAFLNCTVKKRMLLRLEANPNEHIGIFYHDIKDFSYTINSNNNKVNSITIVRVDPTTESLELYKQKWLKYIYYMEGETCKLKIQTFAGNVLDKAIKEEILDTKLSRLPAFVIINGGLLNDDFGESDITDLKSPQNQYNRKVSDFADTLRFNMFPQTVITDATADSVNKISIAPNSLVPLVSTEGKTATTQKLEGGFVSSEPVEVFLKRIEKDMNDTLSIPIPEQLVNIPSAKALKYMYNDLIARCEEKWKDWESSIKELILLIIESCSKFNCYPDWNHEWDNLNFKILLKHNYPIPEDIEDKKTLAMSEVNTNLKSRKTYIKEFGDVEDFNGEWQEILSEMQQIKEVEADQFIPNGDINGN